MQGDILFDNIYIGNSVEDAKKFADETFFEKQPIEQLVELAEKPKDEPKKPKSPSDLVFMDDPVHYIREKVDLFVTIFKSDPVQAIKFVPEVSGTLAAIALALLGALFGIVTAGASSPAVKKTAGDAKAKAVDAKDKVVEATTTATEQAKDAVNKRTTRSTQ